jgi:Tol biopolymer transport system component
MKLANPVCLLLLVVGVVSLGAADSKPEEAAIRAAIDTEHPAHTDAATAEKRGITPADYFAFENISDAHISPDGKQAAYMLTTVDQKRNRRDNSIWLVAIDRKTAPRRLTAEWVNSTSPRWSPDGSRLAFLSARGGQAAASSTGEAPEPPRPQIYVLYLDGGEAQAVTHLKNGAGVFQWSLDGKRLVVLSRTGPSDNVPASAHKSDVRHYSHILCKLNEAGWYDDKRSHLWVVEIGTGAARQLTSGDWNDSDPQWSPDGTRIAFVSDRTGKEFDDALNSNKDIWVIPADGGPLIKISDHDYDDTQPRWSPDGQLIAFAGQTQRR